MAWGDPHTGAVSSYLFNNTFIISKGLCGKKYIFFLFSFLVSPEENSLKPLGGGVNHMYVARV